MAQGKNGYFFGTLGDQEYNSDNRIAVIKGDASKSSDVIIIMENEIGGPNNIKNGEKKNEYIEKKENGLTVKYTYENEGKDLKITWDYKKPEVKKVAEKKETKEQEEKDSKTQNNTESSKGFIQFPNKGIGYDRYLIDPKGDDNWGKPEFVNMLKEIAKKWYEKDKKNKISFGDLSRKNGGELKPHKSHQNGDDADLCLFYNGNRIENMDLPSYDKKKCQEFVSFLETEFPSIKEILFGDKTIKGVKVVSGHRNHMHIGL